MSSALATLAAPPDPRPFRTPFDALSRGAGVEGVRWLLQSRPARAGLAHTIARMLHEPAVVIRLRLRSAVAKPGRRLRAGFVVTVRDATTGLAVTRPILVTWQVLRGNLPVLLPEPAGPEVPASVAAPFRSLTAADPDRAMRLWAWPFDPAFGQLAWLADPANAARLLSGQSRGERSGPEAGYAVTPVRYVPGAAHVLRYDPLGGGRRVGPRSVFAKLYADPLECALRREVIDAAALVVAASSAAVRVPRPMGRTAELGVLLYPGVRGASLAGYLERACPDLGEILCSLGGALRALQTVGAHPGLPSQTLSFEIARTMHATRHLDRFAPVAGASVRRLLQIAAEAGDAIPGERPVLAHGDLKAEHVLISSPARIALIDFDACSGAEPAVDLGRVLAEVRWALPSSRRDALTEVQTQFLRGYGGFGSLPPERLKRARVYELVAFIRIAMRCLELWAPGWPAAAEGALARATEIAREIE